MSEDKTTNTQSLVASDFVHLHNHTHYSLLDGLQKIEPMLDRAKDLGMEAVAMTDHGTLSGVVEFYKAAKDRDINPVIGMEAYVANRKHTDKDPQKDRGRFHMLLFAMNDVGYKNLMKLSSIANLDGYYYKPRIDDELLEEYNEGLIATSGCIGGKISDALRRDQPKQAREFAKKYKDIFGDRFYFEVQDLAHEWDEQAKVNDRLIAMADEMDIPVVVTADAHYTLPTDQEAHEILLCVQTGSTIDEPNRFSLKDTSLYMKTPDEIFERWSDRPDIIKNTKQLADRCSVELDLGGILIPKFDVPKDQTEKSFLRQQVFRGLVWRYTDMNRAGTEKLSIDEAEAKITDEIIERADYELGVISNMGFDGYFLIVADFIQWGKDQDIVFGPGRGSAAGSIVAYAMNITDLDPLKYDLLFERFLNPDRISMPDIDVDIQDNRRDEVIEYCIEKYGQDAIAHIVTFGKMAARNAIRDVSRVLSVPYAEADRLAKLVPAPIQGRHIPLAKSITTDPELKAEYNTNQQSKRVIDQAVQLEGTIRSHGVHAAGVVIAPDDITKYTPLEMSQKGVVTTQYAMGPVEELGLLKMDFLGLSNLTIVKNALRIIEKVYGEEIDITKIPLDDQKVYDLLAAGDTTGIFQFESGGMKRYLKALKPDTFEDIIAMGALYRPGPLTAGLTDQYIARKNGEEAVHYDHPTMEPALNTTYGVIVYQEQVMQIVRDMCGFTGGEADTLRKAVGKKKRKMMAKMKDKVIDGAVKNDVPKEVADKFWTDLEGFADYAFNKSHSACYAMISYWTAYLKAHYPRSFMAALMTSDSGDTDRLMIEISECRHMGIPVLQPDVNESFLEFGVTPKEENIRYGMGAVKNVGGGAVEEILRAREADGPFESIEDFVSRVSTRLVNRKAWESLIKAGAFDSIEPQRGKLLLNLDIILSFGQRLQKEIASVQQGLFASDDSKVELPGLQLESVQQDVPDREKLLWERELLGIYLSSHPLQQYETYLKENTMPMNELTTDNDNQKADIGGILTTKREITTKNGARMAFIGIEDMGGELELVVFPKAYEEHRDLWEQDKVVRVKGKFNAKDRDGNVAELKVLVDSAEEITEQMVDGYESTGDERKPPKKRSKSSGGSRGSSKASKPKQSRPQPPRLYVKLKDPDDNQALLDLKQNLNEYPGEAEVIVVIDRDKRQAIRLSETVEPNESLLSELRQIFSESNVILKPAQAIE
jgi:DNA polymerase-3 subunit alpha